MKQLFYLLIFSLIPHFIFAQFLIVGTYTQNSNSKGIYVYQFDNKKGKLRYVNYVPAENPSYIAINKAENTLYSVRETNKGGIYSFTFNKKTGELSKTNFVENGSVNPCYIAIHPNQNWLVTGNYSSGDISFHNILSNGGIDSVYQTITHYGKSINEKGQEKPHVHCTHFNKDGSLLYVTDLGIDAVKTYAINSKKGFPNAKANTYAAKAGAGPRHLAIDHKNQFAYLLEELSGDVVVLEINGTGLHEKQRVNNLPANEIAAAADIHLTPNGKFLYTSQRSNNTIQCYKINAKNGKLSFVNSFSTLGKTPRNFTIHPSGKFLLVGNQNSNTIEIFTINQKNGILKHINNTIFVDKPVCLIWVNK